MGDRNQAFRFIGNNGNNNDYVLQKVYFTFLKDRSLVHLHEKLQCNFCKGML